MDLSARAWGDRLRDSTTVAGYRAASLGARMLPAFLRPGVTASIGLGANLVSRDRRRMLERHLRRVDPTLRDNELRWAVQRAFESYSRYYVESFQLPTLPAHTVTEGLVVDGFEHVARSHAAGRGTIFALPHLGGWEWAGRWMTDRGYRLTVVVEQLHPPELFEWFVDLRRQLGMTVVPVGPRAAAAVLRALRANEIVCLLCDRDLDRGGVPVDFFGEQTTLPAGPATLALRTGAPILPIAVYFTDRGPNGHLGVVRPPLDLTRRGGREEDVARITQDLAGELEALIRRAPEQWHLLQPNWPSDPGYDPR